MKRKNNLMYEVIGGFVYTYEVKVNEKKLEAVLEIVREDYLNEVATNNHCVGVNDNKQYIELMNDINKIFANDYSFIQRFREECLKKKTNEYYNPLYLVYGQQIMSTIKRKFIEVQSYSDVYAELNTVSQMISDLNEGHPIFGIKNNIFKSKKLNKKEERGKKE